VLPDALEKHCIQAEPILDKNALAGKKAASAHLLLWICRRFSTDAAVLQGFYRRFAGWVVCLLMHWLSAFACQHPLSARFVVLSCTGAGLATFFLKTNNTRAVLALFYRRCRLVCLFADALAVSVRLSASFVGKICRPLLRQCRPCHFLPEDKQHASSVSASFCLAVPGAQRGFSTRSRFLVLVNL
jgi:hypothetical protein